MAAVAGRIGGDMLLRLADRQHVVVAGRACGGESRVAEACAGERVGAPVATVTWRVGWDVLQRLAGCTPAIVAGGAGSSCRGVIEGLGGQAGICRSRVRR